MNLKCRNACDFKQTKIHLLYNEVETPVPTRGKKAAAPNVALKCALQDNTIFNTKSRLLLNALDLRPPSRTGMDKMAAKVAKAQETVAIAGMRQRTAEVTADTGGHRGTSNDCRYDTAVIACSRRTGGILSKQAVTFTCDKYHRKKQIG